MNCTNCHAACRKKGFYKSTQRYQCTTCRKYQQQAYQRPRITAVQREQIVLLNNEGMGISSIGRFLHISKSTVVRKIRHIAANVVRPKMDEIGEEYEIDEMQTYIC